MKVLSLFSGIGAFEKALDYLNIKYELVNYCEIDKYASKAYSLIHNVPETKNLGDITKVDTSKLPKDIDLITYGFPCQDISLAGKQKGFADEDGNITRSGLFFQALRIIEDTKPKIAIAENVKNLVSKKFKNEFEIVLNSLEAAGYNNYWQVLNAKDYGIPQNRERVFIVSIRKDIDNGLFHFPQPYELELRLKDMLEDEVDEKYYLSDAMIDYIVANNEKWTGNNNQSLINKSIASTINTGEGTRRCDASNYICNDLPDNFDLKNTAKLIQAVTLKGGKWDKINESCRRVYDPKGIAPTIHTCQGGNTEPKILIKEATKKGYDEAFEGDSVNLEYPTSTTRRGRVGKGVAQTLTVSCNQGVVVKDKNDKIIRVGKTRSGGERSEILSPEGICSSLTATDYKQPKQILYLLRVRKLTPKECFRLMGFEDDCINVLIDNNISNTQLYKMAGNSIVVDVLEEIFVELFNLRYISLAA